MYIEAEKGMNFYEAVKFAKKEIKETDYLDLKFNDIVVRVSKDSNIDDLSIIYHLKHTINRLKLGYDD
jgi:hypothetical protein